MIPIVGQYLYSTCAGEDYGQIIGVGLDDNGTPVIDILLSNVNDIAWTEDEDEDFPNPDLHSVELPKETPVKLKNVQYRMAAEQNIIICRTPGNGCYRCTKMFWLQNEPTKL